jgi:hypothetical protein
VEVVFTIITRLEYPTEVKHPAHLYPTQCSVKKKLNLAMASLTSLIRKEIDTEVKEILEDMSIIQEELRETVEAMKQEATIKEEMSINQLVLALGKKTIAIAMGKKTAIITENKTVTVVSITEEEKQQVRKDLPKKFK